VKDTLASVRAAPLMVPLALVATAAACGGSDGAAQHQRYLWVQNCAVIDGRPGMPKGLLGGDDVDSIAAYVVARTTR
jgi:hypothetical protein